MRFKNITCLTKVSKNQTRTEKNENAIIFNSSKISIEDNNFNLDVQEREVFFIASCEVSKVKEFRSNRPLVTVTTNWVLPFLSNKYLIEIPSDVTDILIITKEIYDNLKSKNLTDINIYTYFKEKGLGQVSMDLNNIEDFSALVAQVVRE